MSGEFITGYKDSVLRWWGSLNSAKKTSFIALTTITIVLIIVLFVGITRDSYQVLYRGLDPQEAGQIVDRLRDLKVQYRISDGGTAVLVPGSKLNETRLNLAAQGFPKSGIIGYEVFDKTNLGMTDFLQKVNYRRALEGELTKTIASLKEVKGARVHLVIPEQRLFQEDQKQPSASIVLYLDRNMPLSKRQIEGVAYLVASSVEGLSPDNVSILDSSGRLLTARQESDHLAKLSSSQLEMKKNVEAYLQEKAQSMLDAVVGQNRSIVRVSVDLNFEQVERTQESYNPDSVVIRSEETTEESESQSDAADTNRKKDSAGSKKTTVRNYEVNKRIEHLVAEVGNISQLRVSISVDGIYAITKGPDGKMQRQYQPRTQEELDKLVALVRGAVGFSERRNDIIEIANIPFETYQDDWKEQQRIEKEETMQFWLRNAYRLLGFALVVLVLLKTRKALKRWNDRRLAHRRFLEAQAEIKRKAAEIIPKVSQEPKLIDHIRKIADDNPSEMAKVIKTMMAE